MIVTLASSSPRRAEILTRAGIEFAVYKPLGEERMEEGIPAEDAAMSIARQKACEAVKYAKTPVVIAADTIVVTDKAARLLKPRNHDDAFSMLTQLSGKRHSVITAVALADCRQKDITFDIFAEVTDVFMKTLTNDEIDAYIKTGEPMDKAGAYGIQGMGAMFIERIEGDYYNVMGLPVSALYKRLQLMGFSLAHFWEQL